MGLRVEYFYDDESHNWGFVVPSLHIVGSGETREDAEREARDAILFTLEGEDEPVPKDATVVECGDARPLVKP